MKRRYFLNSADTPFDCHCHILPGLDDGSTSLEESLYLAGRLVAYGFRRAVCTSHSTSKYRNSPETVIPACERLQEALDKEGIPLELVPSLEYRLIPETWPEQRHMGLLPWEGNHILIELPLYHPEKMGDIDPANEIRSLIAEGYQPVLAHPERYLWASREEYDRLHEAGAVFQQNLGSQEGFYGQESAILTESLLRLGYYGFLGTDTHSRQYTAFFDKLLEEGQLG